MTVRGIEGDFSSVDPIKGKKSSAPAKQASAGKDKVQVSGEAKSLFEAGQSKRFEEIRKRLHDGYYDSPEVTEKIVDGLMDDLLKTA
jgi:anti-sigma28 factor (negative regulator of flagellin synthesis)